MSKFSGTVKWFSNRKGTLQGIMMEGDYRTLVSDAEVEFEVETEESGKMKAVNVTAPGGAPIKQPPRRERKPKKAAGKKENISDGETEENKDSASPKKETKTKNPPQDPPFHDVISSELKETIKAKGLDFGRKMTVDISLGDSRIKLGQGAYTSMVSASGLVGEGTFTCDGEGLVTFTWERALEYIDGKWCTGDIDKLVKSMSLVNGKLFCWKYESQLTICQDAVTSVGADETLESLWGTEKADPKDALVENKFKMKQVAISRTRRRPFRRRTNGKKKVDEQKAEVAA